RTGIEPGDKAFILYQQIGDMKGIEPVGLHAYDGHISDQDFDQRKTKCEQAFASVEKLKSDLKRSGVNDLVVVAGGSPTFPIHIDHKEVECSPGTFVYWDASYHQSLSEQHFLPAALVISRVISKPGDNLLCLDLGHKSIAAENPLGKRVKFINSPELEFVGQSEEHLVVKYSDDHAFMIGDVLYGMPMHVCPTCALYESAIVIENHEVKGSWKTVARDRKINI
ncbi:MAG TPA: hypothetical protein VNS32_12600, partial [Flavisolibacter sp.]|nr:hypothetical protein [Flavisolibacter sp.]